MVKMVCNAHSCSTTYQTVLDLVFQNKNAFKPGLQLRKSEQKGFHDYFLISQPNPMMWPSLKSSLRDDSNECNIIGFGWEIRKLAFWKLSILDLICCPDSNGFRIQEAMVFSTTVLPFPIFIIPLCQDNWQEMICMRSVTVYSLHLNNMT